MNSLDAVSIPRASPHGRVCEGGQVTHPVCCSSGFAEQKLLQGKAGTLPLLWIAWDKLGERLA